MDRDEQQQRIDQARLMAYEQECRDFRMCFNTPAGAKVLTILANYCSAAQTCVFVPDEGSPIDLHRTLVNEGRRETFLYIQKHLSLDPHQLFAIATGRQIHLTGDKTNE